MGEPKQSLVGYRVVTPQGEVGSRGVLYDYLLARNGLFVRSETELLRATVPFRGGPDWDVRGLAVVLPEVELPRGKVPHHLLALMVVVSVALPTTEHFFAVTWHDGAYQLVYPEQERGSALVTYHRPKGALLELHSHREFGAFFSEQDTRDEQGFGMFGVLSMAGGEPRCLFRAGVYGSFLDVPTEDIFQ